MAWLGHSGSHAPQLMHSSVILKAMSFLHQNLISHYRRFPAA
jgi:hypothetical protein